MEEIKVKFRSSNLIGLIKFTPHRVAIGQLGDNEVPHHWADVSPRDHTKVPYIKIQPMAKLAPKSQKKTPKLQFFVLEIMLGHL